MEVDVGSDPVDCVGNESVRCAETGKVVGFTTSGIWGNLSQKSLVLAFVYGPERWADGTKLQVDILGKKYDAYVKEKTAMDFASVRDKKAAAEKTHVSLSGRVGLQQHAQL